MVLIKKLKLDSSILSFISNFLIVSNGVNQKFISNNNIKSLRDENIDDISDFIEGK